MSAFQGITEWSYPVLLGVIVLFTYGSSNLLRRGRGGPTTNQGVVLGLIACLFIVLLVQKITQDVASLFISAASWFSQAGQTAQNWRINASTQLHHAWDAVAISLERAIQNLNIPIEILELCFAFSVVWTVFWSIVLCVLLFKRR